jgi:hypothetical protein
MKMAKPSDINGYYAKPEATVSSFTAPGIKKAEFSRFPAWNAIV